MIAVAGHRSADWHAGVGVFCPVSPMANAAGMEVLTRPRDLAAVKRAVAASGYRGERAVVLVPSDFPSLKALGDVGVDMLRRAGSTWSRATRIGAACCDCWRRPGRWRTAAGARSTPTGPAWISSIRRCMCGSGATAARPHAAGRTVRSWRRCATHWLFAARRRGRKRIAEDIQRQVFVDVPYIPLGQFLPRRCISRTVTDVLNGVCAVLEFKEGVSWTAVASAARLTVRRHQSPALAASLPRRSAASPPRTAGIAA